MIAVGVPHRLVDGRGVANVVSHLVAHGPSRYGLRRFWAQLVERGRIESFTPVVHRSFTAYVVRCRRGDVEATRDLLIDSLVDVSIDRTGLAMACGTARTVGVVQNELALRAGVARSLSSDLVGLLHRGTPLAHDPAGTVASLPTIDLASVEAHVDVWHRPAQWCTVVLDGDVVLTEPPGDGLDPPDAPRPRLVTRFDGGTGTCIVGAAWSFEPEDVRSPAMAAAERRRQLLSGARLARELRRIGLRPAAAPFVDPTTPFPVAGGLWRLDRSVGDDGRLLRIVDALDAAGAAPAAAPRAWMPVGGGGPEVDRAVLVIADLLSGVAPAATPALRGPLTRSVAPLRRPERSGQRCAHRERPTAPGALGDVDSLPWTDALPSPAGGRVPDGGPVAEGEEPRAPTVASPDVERNVRVRCYHADLAAMSGRADGLRLSSGLVHNTDAELPYVEVEVLAGLVASGAEGAGRFATSWSELLASVRRGGAERTAGAGPGPDVCRCPTDAAPSWSVTASGDWDGRTLRSWIARVQDAVAGAWPRLIGVDAVPPLTAGWSRPAAPPSTPRTTPGAASHDRAGPGEGVVQPPSVRDPAWRQIDPFDPSCRRPGGGHAS